MKFPGSPSALGQLLAGRQPFIIAEVAQAHEGSLGMALSFIDAAANAGADAIKFQTHIADAESTYEEPWRIPFSKQDATRFAYWKRMEFTPEQWAILKARADEKNLIFLSSPFSVAAVELLDRLGVPAWKVASGEVLNPELLAAIRATRKPTIISTGLSSYGEIEEVIQTFRKEEIEVAILQCTSEYPAPPENWGLNVIPEMARRFQCPVGFSDHSAAIAASVAATALGAQIIEAHIAFSRSMFGPDAPASLTVEEFALMVKSCRQVRSSLNSPMDKSGLSEGQLRMRGIFTRSVGLSQDLPAGHRIRESDLTLRKPAGGISPERMKSLVGKVTRKNLSRLNLLREEDFY